VIWLARAALVLLVVALAAMAWIRLAPSDPAVWHVDPRNVDHSGGTYASLARPGEAPAAVLAALDRIAMATPRTRRLAGSPEEGRITWITRTAFWGFPDYTTAAATEAGGVTELSLFARQRFGKADFGVNAARLGSWLAQLAIAP